MRKERQEERLKQINRRKKANRFAEKEAHEEMTPADLLLAAADCIYINGLAKGKAGDGDARCSVAAIHSTNGFDGNGGVFDVAMDSLRTHIQSFSNASCITSWSDATERTKDEVIEAFHEAARGIK